MPDEAAESQGIEYPRVIEIARQGGTAKFALFDETEYIQSHFAAGRFYEEDLLSLLYDRLEPGDLAVDVGANIGNHTIFLAAIRECRVVAIEPFPASFRHLQYNVTLNGLAERVDLIPAAAADVTGRSARVASEDPANSGAVSMELTDEETGIASIRLDDLVLPGPPRLIKIDTEGMELAVLRGAARLLAESAPILAVEAATLEEYDRIAEYLRQFSYVCVDARNVTPTFVFVRHAAVAADADLLERLGRTFAHQRVSLSSDISRLNMRIRQANEAHQRSKSQLAAAQARQKEIEESLVERQAEVSKLQRDREQQTEENRALRETIQTMTEENRALRETIQTMTEESRALREAAQTMTEENRALRETIQTMTEENRALREAIQKETTRVEESQERARRLSADLVRASAGRDRAAKSYRVVAGELDLIRSSESYNVGHAIIKAFTRPGKNTILLPWRLARVLLGIGKERPAGRPNIARRDRDSPRATEALLAQPAPSAAISREPRIEAVPLAARLAEVTDVSQLRVAGIMDEFSFHCYGPECQLLQLTPNGWEEEVSSFNPHLLVVESAWRGKDEMWDRKISHASRELVDLVAWCKERGIPTVFWNKEDPVHFQTFISTARLFDHVFTTDIDCISRYKTILGSDRVSLLLFACQPKLHNPLETYERKDAFCFAGAYYARYPGRIKDLETFVNTLTGVGTLDIYDRNYHEDNPDYAFPEAYRQFIVGHLPPEQIDRAYKGYRYGINLNSIKQSQTMFARRVYELLASNTVTVSNFSRGLRLLFGDLVISTDNGVRLHDELMSVSADETYFRKFRLAGLRKVLTQHTYRDRLAYVAEKALGMARRSPLPHITVTAIASNDAEMDAILQAYHRQRYTNKSLVVVLQAGYEPAAPPSEDDVRLLPLAAAESQQIGGLADDGFVAGMVAQDYYGPNYLHDLALATRYSAASAIGKRSRYKHGAGAFSMQDAGHEYRMIDALPLRSAMVAVGRVGARSLAEWLHELPEGEVRAEGCLSIDEFNYCQDCSDESCPTVDDLDLADTGSELAELEEAAGRARPDDTAFSARQLSGRDILRLVGESSSGAVEMYADGDRLHVSADVHGHEYVYARELFSPDDLGFDQDARVYFDVSPGLDIRLAMIFLNAGRRKLGSVVAVGNRNYKVPLPEGTQWVKLALRMAGTGRCTINRLLLGNVSVDTNTHLSGADILMLSKHYPQYEDLYRNAFLHRRVVEYRKSGRLVDVFRFNADTTGGYSEFDGVDVISGYEDELHRALSSGRYRKVLAHLLEPAMWEVLRDYIEHTQVIVWLHGAEVQPWHRRAFNLSTKEERQRAVEAGEQRVAFWRGIFADTHPNLHFVFVSQYLADEVMEDYDVRLSREFYSVIHNVIDTQLFAYHPKAAEDRKRILSIQSYASRKYANDLTVKAILELSKEPFFGGLEFRLIGDGRLFEETVAPLRQFPNVILERRFVRQDEIPGLHRKHGVFMVPTRWDSQGVSRDEAMSSGLVPITNRVAAVPEFVDEECGILVDAEDHAGLARALAKLYHDPDLFLRLSKAAADRVRRQRGPSHTIAKELQLLR